MTVVKQESESGLSRYLITRVVLYIHQLDDGVVDKYKTNVLYNMSFIIAHVENTLS